VDVVFFEKTYRELRKKKPISFREDFCGTFSICCEWVKLSPNYQAYGLDLDPEPIAYGKEHYLSLLSPQQQKRVHIEEKNVLDARAPSCDIVAALNFSYFIFKQRAEMLSYFRQVHKRLSSQGIFIIDAFGGSKCQEANEEETEHDDFSYFWDQDNYDPVTNFAQYYIHFKRKGEKKREKVFSYDWRMWSLPELKDILEEVGFKKVHVYWEGTTKDGEGDGEFKRVDRGEECEAWVAYLISEK
jgi:hypothetical protein